MNISFYDGINDGKFFNISAGKYDDLDDIDDINMDDIAISEEIEDEEDDANTCINRFVTLEKDASKIHMDLNNLRNEFKGSCKDWNDLSDTVDHMLNSIAELRTMMDKVNDRVNNRFKVVSEAIAELDGKLNDKLNLVEKKLEVFKCIDILDRVTKLEEQIKPTALEEAKELEVNPSVLDRIRRLEEDNVSTQLKVANVASKDIRDDVRLHSIDLKLKKLEKNVETLEGKHLTTSNSNKLAIGRLYERLGKVELKLEKLERDLTSNGMLIADLGRDIVNTDCELNSLSDRVSKLDSKLAVTAKIVENRVPFIKDKLGPKTESIVEDLKKQIGRSQIEPGKNDIQDDPVNHPKHYTDGKYECIDFIEEYGTITHIGNAIKYASRAGKKDEDAYIEDLKKGLWYLHRYNCPPKKKHIDVIDYCKDKKLPDELTNVLIAISRENYVEAERVLRKYIEELKK